MRRFLALLNFHCHSDSKLKRKIEMGQVWAEVGRKIVNSNRMRSDFLHRSKCGRPSSSSVRKSYRSWKLVQTKHTISNLHPTFSIPWSHFRMRCIVLVFFFFFIVYKNSAHPSTTGMCVCVCVSHSSVSGVSVWRKPIRIVHHHRPLVSNKSYVVQNFHPIYC